MDNLLTKERSCAGHTKPERLQMTFFISIIYLLAVAAIVFDGTVNTLTRYHQISVWITAALVFAWLVKLVTEVQR